MDNSLTLLPPVPYHPLFPFSPPPSSILILPLFLYPPSPLSLPTVRSLQYNAEQKIHFLV